MLSTIRLRAAVILACAGLFAACSSAQQPTAIPRTVAANTAHRSLADFLAAQGSCLTPEEVGTPAPGSGAQIVGTCVLFVPYAPNFEGWGVAPSTSFCNGYTVAAVDYAGVVNTWLGSTLGTTISGSVNEERLHDGTNQVTVVMNTHNALAWAGCAPDFNFVDATVLFGNRPDAVLTGATPALANSVFRVVYTEPSFGAAFPDLVALNFNLGGYAWKSMQFHAEADGPLSSAFESVANGTPGHLVIGQNGTFNTHGKGSIDGFTAEFIHLTTK